MTLRLFVTYIRSVQKSYRHVYHWGTGATRIHFRFAVSSDVFKQPGVMGRPKGVFNADCFGFTLQDQEADKFGRANINQNEEPNTPNRFPRASSFGSIEQAALECDFWKLVLLRKYFLEIPWSHESFEAYVDASHAHGIDPLERLADESQWTYELLDFINEHFTKLLQHREAHKPEVDLDQWEQRARDTGDHKIKTWVEIVRELQRDLDKFNVMCSERHLNQLRRLVSYLEAATKVGLPEYQRNRSDLSEDINKLREQMHQIGATLFFARDLLTKLEHKRVELTYAVKKATDSRPQIS